jgi:hypothetical protein
MTSAVSLTSLEISVAALPEYDENHLQVGQVTVQFDIEPVWRWSGSFLRLTSSNSEVIHYAQAQGVILLTADRYVTRFDRKT